MQLYLGYEASDDLLEKLSRTGFEGCWRTYEHPHGERVDWDLVHAIGQALGRTSIDLVVSDVACREKSAFASYRVWGGRFPNEPYVTDGSDVLVASPEFSLMLAAAELSDTRLMQMVMRYCGCYSPNPSSPDGFDGRPPMTSIAQVEELLAQVSGVPGAKRLRRALRWSAEMSRSPMETNLMLALTLPKTSNGFGLPKPEMNKLIRLEGLAAEIAGKTHCYGDLVFGDYILEYQGRRHNDTIGDDLTRALALELMGFTVDFVAYEQFRDARQLDLVARRAAKAMGRWVDSRKWHEVWRAQELVDLLLKG